jgi:hypothetical protein
MCGPTKSIIVIIGLSFLTTAHQRHYNSRSLVDGFPEKSGHVKQNYYH